MSCIFRTIDFDSLTAAQNGNVTLPDDMSSAQSKVNDAKQDVQNAISNISEDQKQLMNKKNVEDAEKKLQNAEREISAIWKNLRQQLEKAGGEHKLNNAITVLNNKANSLEVQANKQGNPFDNSKTINNFLGPTPYGMFPIPNNSDLPSVYKFSKVCVTSPCICVLIYPLQYPFSDICLSARQRTGYCQ